MEKLIAIHILLLLILGLIRRLLFVDRLLQFETCIRGTVKDRGGLCALYFINHHASGDGVISMFTVIQIAMLRHSYNLVVSIHIILKSNGLSAGICIDFSLYHHARTQLGALSALL